jgi:hypothetical protein
LGGNCGPIIFYFLRETLARHVLKYPTIWSLVEQAKKIMKKCCHKVVGFSSLFRSMPDNTTSVVRVLIKILAVNCKIEALCHNDESFGLRFHQFIEKAGARMYEKKLEEHEQKTVYKILCTFSL